MPKHKSASIRSGSTSAVKRRKTNSAGPSASAPGQTERKKIRLSADQLKWKSIKATSFAGVDEGGGMMMLEELDDVGVEWEEGAGGTKVARFVANEPVGGIQAGDESDVEASADEDEPVEVDDADGVPEGSDGDDDDADGADGEDADQVAEEGFPDFADVDADDLDEEDEEEHPMLADDFNDALLPEWLDIPLHSALKRALLAIDIVKPTEIQARALPAGLSGKDVVGVAETGSGKTLAYSLPILSHVLSSKRKRTSSSKRPLSALILCPTRELAIQVVDHLKRLLQHVEAQQGDGEGETNTTKKPVGPPLVSIGSVVGGLSAQKQKRIVDRGCDILVATPGRLWDLIKADEDLAAGIRSLRFLVIDEADRMIENGHFVELESIVRLTQRASGQPAGDDDDDPMFAEASTALTQAQAREDMQTFVFSATLSKDLQQNLKKRNRKPMKKGARKATALEDLVEKLDFRDKEPEVIDLSPEGVMVKTLKESILECVITDKDLYLYYFLLRYPGRSIVFIGSIDGIRRLIPLFELLQVPVYPLHSQLQQRQRLKNLDKFKSSKDGVLIATDVAARGLDIPQVDHVIHFNLPRTADAYIHRSGRTARAQNPGFALQLCAPEEKGMQRALMKSLGKTQDLPELPIEPGFMPKLKERIRLAREIETAQHEVKKDKHEKTWLQEAAEALDVDIDEDMLSDEDTYAHRSNNSKKGKKQPGGAKPKSEVALANLRAELKHRLSEPLIARGISTRYPTSGSKVIVDDLISSRGHGNLLGAHTGKAWDEVGKVRKHPSGSKRKRPAAAINKTA